MKRVPLLTVALLGLAASPLLAAPPPGYRVEGCESGTCRLVKEGSGSNIGRGLDSSPAYRQAQRG